MISTSNGCLFRNLAAGKKQLNQIAQAQEQQELQKNTPQLQQNNTAGAAPSAAFNGNFDANAAPKQNAMQQQSFFFRATGINRKLKTPVIFDGNYIAAGGPQSVPAQNQLAAQNSELKTETGENAKLGEKNANEAENARIEGQAQVGAAGTIDIDAVAVPAKAKGEK
jgi:hypothetical protein